MFRRLLSLALPVVFAIVNTIAPAPTLAATDANQASQAELESVKGIGPRLSGRILEARQAGAFKNWSDLIERVPGVGNGNAARYSQAGLTVAGSGYDAATAPAKAAKGERSAKTEKAAKTEKTEKSEKTEKTDRRERRSDGEVRASRAMPSPAQR